MQGVAGLRPVLFGPLEAAAASFDGVRYRVGGQRRPRLCPGVSGVEDEENAQRWIRESIEGSSEASARVRDEYYKIEEGGN